LDLLLTLALYRLQRAPLLLQCCNLKQLRALNHLLRVQLHLQAIGTRVFQRTLFQGSCELVV